MFPTFFPTKNPPLRGGFFMFLQPIFEEVFLEESVIQKALLSFPTFFRGGELCCPFFRGEEFIATFYRHFLLYFITVLAICQYHFRKY